MTTYEVDPNDFLIQISPSVDEEHNWTGEISNDTAKDDPYFFKQNYTSEGNIISVNFNKEGK